MLSHFTLMLATDIDRGRALAKLLHEAFRTTGVHGRTDMPGDVRPMGVERGSLEHILFLTLTASIDYRLDANALWDIARRTFEYPGTRYLFDPSRLNDAPWRQVGADMKKHGLSKKPGKDCNIWRTVGITFHKKWNGDLLMDYLKRRCPVVETPMEGLPIGKQLHWLRSRVDRLSILLSHRANANRFIEN